MQNGLVIHGLVLAAGAGSRFGGPKALFRDETGLSWLMHSVSVLIDGGCSEVTVALGASAGEAESLLRGAGFDPSQVRTLRVDDWASGMGASLRTGLQAIIDQRAAPMVEAVLVHLVDLPDVNATVVQRLLKRADNGSPVLARATYFGRPGHPVLLGQQHWRPVLDAATGDQGARGYLAAHNPVLVECGDLANGADVDKPPERPR